MRSRPNQSEKKMWSVGNSSAWRAILLVCALIGAPPELQAAQLNSPASAEQARADEPFGLSTATVSTGALLEKWLGVEHEVADQPQLLRIFAHTRTPCHSQPTLH